MYADDHRGRHAGRLEEPAPLRDPLSVAREHDRPGRIWRDVHRNPPATVVAERLGDQFSRYRVGARRSGQCSGTAATGYVVVHRRTPYLKSRRLDRHHCRRHGERARGGGACPVGSAVLPEDGGRVVEIPVDIERPAVADFNARARRVVESLGFR